MDKISKLKAVLFLAFFASKAAAQIADSMAFSDLQQELKNVAEMDSQSKGSLPTEGEIAGEKKSELASEQIKGQESQPIEGKFSSDLLQGESKEQNSGSLLTSRRKRRF